MFNWAKANLTSIVAVKQINRHVSVAQNGNFNQRPRIPINKWSAKRETRAKTIYPLKNGPERWLFAPPPILHPSLHGVSIKVNTYSKQNPKKECINWNKEEIKNEQIHCFGNEFYSTPILGHNLFREPVEIHSESRLDSVHAPKQSQRDQRKWNPLTGLFLKQCEQYVFLNSLFGDC